MLSSFRNPIERNVAEVIEMICLTSGENFDGFKTFWVVILLSRIKNTLDNQIKLIGKNLSIYWKKIHVLNNQIKLIGRNLKKKNLEENPCRI